MSNEKVKHNAGEDTHSKEEKIDTGKDPKPDSYKSRSRKKSSLKELEKTIMRLEEENKQLKTENAQVKDSLLRQMAEFDNYKKRTQREFSELIANANALLIKDILQIIDELDLSLKSSEENKDFYSFHEGINHLYTKFLDILKQKGLKPVESVGKEFDTDHHEAVMQMEKKDTPSNTVIEEYQKGYMLNERILRHAKVVVSK